MRGFGVDSELCHLLQDCRCAMATGEWLGTFEPDQVGGCRSLSRLGRVGQNALCKGVVVRLIRPLSKSLFRDRITTLGHHVL